MAFYEGESTQILGTGSYVVAPPAISTFFVKFLFGYLDGSCLTHAGPSAVKAPPVLVAKHFKLLFWLECNFLKDLGQIRFFSPVLMASNLLTSRFSTGRNRGANVSAQQAFAKDVSPQVTWGISALHV